MLLILSLTSCEKEENFLPAPDPVLTKPVSSENASAKSAITGLNEEVVKEFYEQLLELQGETNFYPAFVEEHGPIDWSRILQFEDENGGYVLTIPTYKSEESLNTGLFLYHFSSTDHKIKFVTRGEYDGKVAAMDFTGSSAEKMFIYRNLYLNDLKTDDGKGPDEVTGDIILTEGNLEEECQGGSYQYICIRISGNLAPEHDASRAWGMYNIALTQIHSQYGDVFDIDHYNGRDLNDLTPLYDALNDDDPSNDEMFTWNFAQAFNIYYNMRIQLAALSIGNDIASDGLLSWMDDPHNQVIQSFIDCQYVFIHCWEDSADYEWIANPGGSGSSEDVSLEDPWRPNYHALSFCHGVNDLFDTNGGPSEENSTSTAHPNYAACVIWQDYLENCILETQPDFNNIDNPSYEDMMMEWARLQWANEELFDEIIADAADCVPTSDLGEYEIEATEEDCFASLQSFMTTYDVELTRPEQDHVLNGIETGACGEQDNFDQLACALVLQTEIEKLENNIVFLCNNENPSNILESIASSTCGIPSENGLVDDFYSMLSTFDFIVAHESFSENTKLSCIWSEIIQGESDLICTTLSNFMGPTKKNIYLYMTDFGPSSTNRGNTDISDNGNFQISINQRFVEEACYVEITRTILHESIHAEILRRGSLHSLQQRRDLYPAMMFYFDNYDNFHHEYMANEWITEIAESVELLHPNLSQQQYEMLAWGGLRFTEAFTTSGYTREQLTENRETIREDCQNPCAE